MLEFEKDTLVFKLHGIVHEVRKPNVAEARVFAKKSTSGEFDEFDLILDYLEDLGFKKEFSEAMEPHQLGELIEHLSAKKKK